MPANSVFGFSTDVIPANDRLAVWREVIGRQYMSLDIEPVPSFDFRAQIKLHNLPPTRVAVLQSTPTKYVRTRQHAQAGNADFTFVCPAQDGFRFYRDEHEVAFGAGEALLLCNSGVGTIEVPEDGQAITVSINGTALRAAVRDLDDGRPHRLRADSLPLKLVTAYLGSILQSAALDRPLGHLVNTHLTDLIALALRPTAETRERARMGAVQAARLAAIRQDVAANLQQLSLSAKSMARRHGVSERYVHLLFEHSGTSFARFIVHERLRRALTMLLDPACDMMRISDIAFAVGFSDLTAFNRAFRRRYGDTPRAIRRSRGDGDAQP